MTYALLGDIVFELIGAPTAMDDHQKAVYAEHAVLASKPVLQAMGLSLTEINIDMYLHYVIADVEARYQTLLNAKDKLEPLALVMGNAYKGHFVIKEIESDIKFTDESGAAMARTVSVKLTEFVGDVTPPVIPPAVMMGNNAPLSAIVTDFIDAPSANLPIIRPPGLIEKGLAAFNRARFLIRQAQGTIAMIKENPAMALSMISGLATQFGTWLGEWSDTFGELANLSRFTELGEKLVGIGSFIDGMSSIASNIDAIYRASTSFINTRAIDPWISISTDMVQKGERIATDIMGPVSQMTAWVSIRTDLE